MKIIANKASFIDKLHNLKQKTITAGFLKFILNLKNHNFYFLACLHKNTFSTNEKISKRLRNVLRKKFESICRAQLCEQNKNFISNSYFSKKGT